MTTLTGAVVLGMATCVHAQVDTSIAQKKALSRRAAEADAYRNLAECIRGLQINSDTYVQDFVAESDTIRGAMDDFIKGVRLGEPRWFDDLSCEVPAEVTVAKVVETLKEVHTRYYKGDRIKGSDFRDMEQRIEKKVIQVVGMGAPREDLPPDLPQGVAEKIGAPATAPEPFVPDLWRQMGPSARMMAIRAAELDAKRKLLERIKGLRITSDTLVRDFVAETDSVTAQAQGLVVGARRIREYLHADEPIAEVTVEVPVESVVTIVKQLHTRTIQGDDIKGTDLSQVKQSIKGQSFQATGMGIPPQRLIDRYQAQANLPQLQFPEWATERITMKGNGAIPADMVGTAQGKLMAARAAELDAKRKLAEYVKGLTIRSETKVKDFVAEHDEIASHVDAVLVGSTVESTTFEGDMAEVVVAIPGMEIWDVLNNVMR
jgi:hypothetical protein